MEQQPEDQQEAGQEEQQQHEDQQEDVVELSEWECERCGLVPPALLRMSFFHCPLCDRWYCSTCMVDHAGGSHWEALHQPRRSSLH